MKTGKTDVLNMISMVKKTNFHISSNGFQSSFRDKLSRQTEEMLPSYSQNKKHEDKTKESESQPMKNNSALKKNFKMESQKKYSAEIKSHENSNGLKTEDFAPMEDKFSLFSADGNILSKDKDDDIEMAFDSDVRQETEEEILSDGMLLSSDIYSAPLLVSSKMSAENDTNRLTVSCMESLITEDFSEKGESVLTAVTVQNETQLGEDNTENLYVWNESKNLSLLFPPEQSARSEIVKNFRWTADVSSFHTDGDEKRMFSVDDVEEEVFLGYHPQGVQEEDHVLSTAETKENSFLTNDFNDSSDQERKIEPRFESEKTIMPSFHKNAVSIREHTFEEVIESKLESHVDSGKMMLEDIRYQINQSKKQMKIQLKPKELGEMTLDLQVFKGGIVAKIFVDNEKSKFVIEQNLSQLRETFKNSGTEIKTVEVFVGNSANFQMNQQSMTQSRSSGHSMNYHKNSNGYTEMSTMEETLEQEAVITEGFDVLA